MNVFERFVFLLQREVTTPVPYGWYHLGCLALTVGLTVLLCLRCRDAGERTVDRLLFVAWLLMVVAEVYKQTVFSMDVTDGVATWSYSWYSFPYQFCSTPIYVLPFAILGRGRVREAALAFMMSFSLFGGLAVMVYPGDVYVPTLGVDVQTMLHHGLQVVLGIYLAVYLRRRLGLRHFATALPVFAVTVALALLLNVTVYHALAASGGEVPTFNMFFISPYFECTLPLVGAISAALPYPVFLLVYLVGFSLAAFVVYGAVWGLYRLAQRRGAA